MFQRDTNRDIPRRRFRMELPQLQRDALAQVAGADAGRLQRLDQGEDMFDVIESGLDLRQQAQAYIFQLVLQITVVGDGVRDDARDGNVDGGPAAGEDSSCSMDHIPGVLAVLVMKSLLPVINRPTGACPRDPPDARPEACARDFALGLLFSPLMRPGGVLCARRFGHVSLRRARTSSRSRATVPNGSERTTLFRLEHHVVSGVPRA